MTTDLYRGYNCKTNVPRRGMDGWYYLVARDTRITLLKLGSILYIDIKQVYFTVHCYHGATVINYDMGVVHPVIICWTLWVLHKKEKETDSIIHSLHEQLGVLTLTDHEKPTVSWCMKQGIEKHMLLLAT